MPFTNEFLTIVNTPPFFFKNSYLKFTLLIISISIAHIRIEVKGFADVFL